MFFIKRNKAEMLQYWMCGQLSKKVKIAIKKQTATVIQCPLHIRGVIVCLKSCMLVLEAMCSFIIFF